MSAYRYARLALAVGTVVWFLTGCTTTRDYPPALSRAGAVTLLQDSVREPGVLIGFFPRPFMDDFLRGECARLPAVSAADEWVRLLERYQGAWSPGTLAVLTAECRAKCASPKPALDAIDAYLARTRYLPCLMEDVSHILMEETMEAAAPLSEVSSEMLRFFRRFPPSDIGQEDFVDGFADNVLGQFGECLVLVRIPLEKSACHLPADVRGVVLQILVYYDSDSAIGSAAPAGMLLALVDVGTGKAVPGSAVRYRFADCRTFDVRGY